MPAHHCIMISIKFPRTDLYSWVERASENKVSFQRTQQSDPGQRSDLDCLIRRPVSELFCCCNSPNGRHAITFSNSLTTSCPPINEIDKFVIMEIWLEILKICCNYSFQVLYMDAVQNLPDDIQDIVDLMIEKEIRLRAPLEEVELLLH